MATASVVRCAEFLNENHSNHLQEAIMATCETCGKKAATGMNVSFSKRHTKRKFRVNTQNVKVLIGDKFVRMTLCTKCMKALAKTGGKGSSFYEKMLADANA
jgi:large subunit ribosomal protein L28